MVRSSSEKSQMLNVRDLAPGRGNHPLRKIANTYGVIVIEINAHFFQSFAHGCNLVVFIFGISLPARQSDMPVPFVPYPRRAFYEEQFGIPMLNPILRKEGFQSVLERSVARPARSYGRASPLLSWRRGVWMMKGEGLVVCRGPMRVMRLYTEYESD